MVESEFLITNVDSAIIEDFVSYAVVLRIAKYIANAGYVRDEMLKNSLKID